MNHVFYKLAYEAEDYADSIVDQGGEFHPAYTKKFAELIVQECMQLAQSYPIQNDEYAAGIDSVRDSIKKHFGVEE